MINFITPKSSIYKYNIKCDLNWQSLLHAFFRMYMWMLYHIFLFDNIYYFLCSLQTCASMPILISLNNENHLNIFCHQYIILPNDYISLIHLFETQSRSLLLLYISTIFPIISCSSFVNILKFVWNFYLNIFFLS